MLLVFGTGAPKVASLAVAVVKSSAVDTQQQEEVHEETSSVETGVTFSHQRETLASVDTAGEPILILVKALYRLCLCFTFEF